MGENKAAPLPGSDNILRFSVGDITADGGNKEIMFVTGDKRLKLYEVEASKSGTLLRSLEKKDGKNLNYPYDETDLIGASFLDVDDVGTHSILLETTDGKLKGYLYVNGENNYFIKGLGYDKTADKEHNNGQPRVGLSYQYLMTDTSGTEKLRIGHQTIANAYRNLQLPYMLDGLGRCQNYVEYFSFGYYKDTGTSQYTPVIPNSQLIISMTNEGLDIQLLVNPSENLLLIFFFFWGIFLIMSGIAIALQVRERKQDNKEKKQQFIITA